VSPRDQSGGERSTEPTAIADTSVIRHDCSGTVKQYFRAAVVGVKGPDIGSTGSTHVGRPRRTLPGV